MYKPQLGQCQRVFENFNKLDCSAKCVSSLKYEVSTKKRELLSTIYYNLNIDGVNVCKQIFLKMLGISEKCSRNCMKKVFASPKKWNPNSE